MMASRLRVVLVAHDVHDDGGMERACAELVRHARTDVDFTVVSCTLAPELRDAVRWYRVPAPSRPFLLKFLAFAVLAGIRLRSLDGLRHAIGAIVPNRVDLAEIQFCHAGCIAATRRLAPSGAPLLRRVNTTATRVASLAAEAWCYRPSRLRAFAAVSSGIAEELRRFYPRIRVAVTPNGVDAPELTVSDGTGAAPRAGATVALFVGGDWDRKGLSFAIDGVAAATELGADIELWVVGRGDEGRFERLAARAGVADRVRFFGFRSDVERFYSAAEVFVMPTEYEAHPLVALEAAAAGLPVVVTRVNGVDELIGGDEAGILVDRSAASVGAALARLALDPVLRAQQSRAARDRTRELTWERSSARFVSLYRELAAQT
jgi:glycosyltransferase involved in cell wall biosynthesis